MREILAISTLYLRALRAAQFFEIIPEGIIWAIGAMGNLAPRALAMTFARRNHRNSGDPTQAD
jgi:hypothetical protein